MDVFELHAGKVEDYRSFTSSFVEPREARIAEHVQDLMESGAQWPPPWLSLNPAFAPGGRSRSWWTPVCCTGSVGGSSGSSLT